MDSQRVDVETVPGGRASLKAPRVLYLAFYFPPSRASGVFRAKATANYLAQSGWDVTVFTAPREFFSYYLNGAHDESLDDTLQPGIRVVRPPMNTYPWETDIRRFGFWRRNFPLVADKLYGASQKWIFPETYLGWVPGVLRRAIRLHLRQRFDLILATGNPFVSFAVAWLLGRTLGLPYVVDYRDAWTFNQFTEEVRFPPGSPALRWERRVLKDTAEAVFVNDAMRRWHMERYPDAADRMTVVSNGWEPETFGKLEFCAPVTGRPVRFGYLGTVTSYMPLDVLFDGWRLARTHPLLKDSELNIYGHLGFFPGDVEPLRQRIAKEADEGVSYRGSFPKARAVDVYRATDVLVFCVPGARYVTSGKVFEYMASGKPIVSVHRPNIAASEVLSGYPLWFRGRRLDTDDVASAFIEAAEAAQNMDRASYDAAIRHAQRFTRAAVFEPWERRLRSIAKGSR